MLHKKKPNVYLHSLLHLDIVMSSEQQGKNYKWELYEIGLTEPTRVEEIPGILQRV